MEHPAAPAGAAPALERLRAARRLVLTTHRGPDPDGLATQVAVARALRARGVDVRVVNGDPLPPRLAFLDPDGLIERWRDVDGPALLDAADAVVLVDVADIDRTGDLEKPLEARRDKVLALDHHLPEARSVGGVVDPDVSSCGELGWRLLGWLGAPIDAGTATALYTAITYDTSSFRWLRNQPGTLRVAAELIAAGADAGAIQEALWGARPKDHARLVARAVEAAQWECDGRLAWVVIDDELTRDLTVDREAYREVIGTLLGIDGVVVAASFQVEGKRRSTVRLSLRSKLSTPVVSVARRHGGGGHAHACGATVTGKKAQATIRDVLDAVAALLTPSAP